MSKRFISPFDAPQGREREILEIINEECLEIVDIANEIIEFGPQEIDPVEGDSFANLFMKEYADLVAISNIAFDEGVLVSGQKQEVSNHDPSWYSITKTSLSIAKRIQKAQRFGLEESQPGHSQTNGDRIVIELNLLHSLIRPFIKNRTLPPLHEDNISKKLSKLSIYMQNQ